MAYRFFINTNKPFISYKPTAEHWRNYIIKCKGKSKNREATTFAFVKYGGLEKQDFAYYDLVIGMLSTYTPNKIIEMFPITKDYTEMDGFKNYLNVYATLVNNYTIDKPLGDRTFEFLMDYLNIDIELFVVNTMCAMSDKHRERTGKGLVEDFFGLKPHTLTDDGQVYGSDGQYLGKVVKPKNSIKWL